jgi:hypothetical protein
MDGEPNLLRLSAQRRPRASQGGQRQDKDDSRSLDVEGVRGAHGVATSLSDVIGRES